MIRKAKLKDLDQILNLWQQMASMHESFDPSFKLNNDALSVFKPYAESVIKDEKKLSIVYDEDQVKGYLFAEIMTRPPVFYHKEVGMINEVSVNKADRRSNIGHQLLCFAEDWFKNKGITLVYCQLASSNVLSSNFWAKNNYKEYSKLCSKAL